MEIFFVWKQSLFLPTPISNVILLSVLEIEQCSGEQYVSKNETD